ncbi:hypothetical protein GQX73_g9632 [Xylaria multiplex]|uniref:Zinc finger GRF-type domain-containing protein n=1 Tax=Xylaria multiplex TaxID=323545 RepID=A0A7C8MNH4_9PEZI|nr:hypothetical protein GQX73_g9632 [Xylaria multiplex]
MPSPPSSPPASPSSSSPSSSPQPRRGPTNGIFRNGNWLCNCEPPRLATLWQVKKEKSKYKGEKFYGCPIKKGEGNLCDMFVLMDEAGQRQREAFNSNGRSEKKRQTTIHESFTPRKSKQELGEQVPAAETSDLQAVDNEASTSNPAPPSTTAESSTLGKGPYSGVGHISDASDTSSSEDEDGGRINSPTPRIPKSTSTLQSSTMARTPTTQPIGSKRKRPSEEEDLLDDLSASGEEELAAVTDRSSKAASTAGKRHDAPITPSVPRTTDMANGLPTPSDTKGKSVKRVLFAKDESTRNGAKRQCLDAGELFGTTATIDSTSTSPAKMVSEVMDLLKEEKITPAARNAVRETLWTYAKQAKGYELGRDVSRKAIKELEERCAQLRAELDASRAENDGLRTKNENLEKGRKKGRDGLLDLWDNLEKTREGAMELWNKV